eukprot:9437827-Alexandrium_andersonii.AAC.1
MKLARAVRSSLRRCPQPARKLNWASTRLGFAIVGCPRRRFKSRRRGRHASVPAPASDGSSGSIRQHGTDQQHRL